MTNFVKDKVDYTLSRNEIICPYCSSSDIKTNSHSQTLLAGNPDPNHHTLSCSCNNCQKTFKQEYKYANVWYTNENNRLLKGIPNCFENYVYSCSYCINGAVKRKYTAIDGFSEVKYLTYDSNGKKKDFRIFWECDGCRARNETEEDQLEEAEWFEIIIKTDKNLWESSKEYITKHYKEYEEFRTKKVLRFQFTFAKQSTHFSDKNNLWAERLPLYKDLKINIVEMYWCKLWANSEEGWQYSVPWKVYEMPALTLYNPKGIEKLNFELVKEKL